MNKSEELRCILTDTGVEASFKATITYSFLLTTITISKYK
jgi:hypothetical protein